MTASAGASSPRVRRAIVVGAGVAGLMAAHELAARGQPVLLLSLSPAARARSAAARGGINAALDEADADQHLQDTLRAGAFAAPPAAVRAMVRAAPGLVARLARAGVPFLRATPGGFARFAPAGARVPRTVLAGADTGRQVLGVLDAQVRRWEGVEARDERGLRLVGEPMVRRLEHWDLAALIQDDNGVIVGVVARDRRTLRCRALRADGVCLATGSAVGLFVPLGQVASASGAGVALAWRAGAAVASAEAVACHPAAVLTHDDGFALAEGLRGEGARIWMPRDPDDARPPAAIPEGEREYPLDGRGDGHGGLPRAEAARALFSLGGDAPAAPGGRAAYVELAALDPRALDARLGRVLAAAGAERDASGRWLPLRVFPRVCAPLGGLWVDHEPAPDGALRADSPRNHATSLPGLYAAGGCAALYHGAGLLGGDDLLACLFGATRAAAAMTSYRAALARRAEDLPGAVFERGEAAAEAERTARLGQGDAGEGVSPFALQRELARAMTSALTGDADALEQGQEALASIAARARAVALADRGTNLNQCAEQALHLDHLLCLATIVLAARARPRDRDGSPRRRSLALADGGEVLFVGRLAYDCAGRRVEVTDLVADPPAGEPSAPAPAQPPETR